MIFLKKAMEKKKKAVGKGDFNDVQTTKLMIEIATKNTAEYSEELKELRKEQTIMADKKRTICDKSIEISSAKKKHL